MEEPEAHGQGGAGAPSGSAGAGLPRYGRYVGLLGIVIVALITINTLVTKPNGDSGVAPGSQVPPFAVPLALGSLAGDANVATPGNLGQAGRVPACTVRGPQVLNICQLYEAGPVVLALFVDGGSCPAVLSDMQVLRGEFPRVAFAAVAIKGERASVRRLIARRHLSFAVGLDPDGALAAFYKVASCPQLTFILKGGAVQSKALLNTPSEATLRARVGALQLAASPAGG